ncbi:glycosyltransferase [Paracoccus sulfuroxidans]|uniref:Putative rhamnosyltransferase n=1 Tax=Paracoccus sulfuroxidans TaxID=384678 RepID=A0A562P0U6_9RHOB|nr:glycosyltransferase [Paracoccus sulfuroxidans]TWI38045.1 putative rhamnosyltransferase [Paracoccus sulfuroxidans]
MDRIIGICRFSYVGRSDWKAFAGTKGQDEALLARVAAGLFQPDRMEKRFRSFRDVTLASVAAQTDPDFTFLVISSNRMPQPMQQRLLDLCAGVAQVKVVFAAEPTLGEVLAPILEEIAQQDGRPPIQFRLDDDDGIPARFIQRLRAHATRLSDLEQFGICFNRGMMIKLEPGRKPVPLSFQMPFLGAGCAVRLANPRLSIFAIGHYQIPRRMTVIQDNDQTGALVLRWVDSDSVELDLQNLPKGVEILPDAKAGKMFSAEYPWLHPVAIEALLNG